METITAIFFSPAHLDQAIDELKKQGVVTLWVQEDGTCSPSSEKVLVGDEVEGEPLSTLGVIVESSRFRQAAETIEKFGGYV